MELYSATGSRQIRASEASLDSSSNASILIKVVIQRRCLTGWTRLLSSEGLRLPSCALLLELDVLQEKTHMAFRAKRYVDLLQGIDRVALKSAVAEAVGCFGVLPYLARFCFHRI